MTGSGVRERAGHHLRLRIVAAWPAAKKKKGVGSCQTGRGLTDASHDVLNGVKPGQSNQAALLRVAMQEHGRTETKRDAVENRVGAATLLISTAAEGTRV
uniref:Uncharacterized protein n=1 Tax=Hyaloperonospora arabidopsidis (strain Emoy2) TaxID=559515 RepID=M4C152_HYAAE